MTGILLLMANAKVVEAKAQYDGVGTRSQFEACAVDDFEQWKQCEVRIKVPKRMKAPVYVYYELSSLHQNHRRYTNSLNHDQLTGSVRSKEELSSCAPLKVNGTKTLNPCGLVPNTMFSDVIRLDGMKETSIALASDKRSKFKQPKHFSYASGVTDIATLECLGVPCSTDLCRSHGLPAHCFGYECRGGDFDQGKCDEGELALFYYPDHESYQYLWQTYPHTVSPLVGVENEHFIVWMRTAALPHFRKVYGRLEVDVPARHELVFNVSANYWVRKFDGRKWLVVSTHSPIGGKNAFLGVAYVVTGALCVALSAAFATLQLLFPRRMGDVSQATTRVRKRHVH